MSKKTLFCVSDIHGFYDEFNKALYDAGYEDDNENHYLIVLGDCFDRGNKPIEVMTALHNKPRTILVRGNHEDLFLDMCSRGYPCFHDYSNGTWDTFCKIRHTITNPEVSAMSVYFEVHPFLESMVDYFETKNYVFVHGWIPCEEDNGVYYPLDWRRSDIEEWEKARWLNPFKLSKTEVIVPGKKIVCGHWHCSTGWAEEFGLSEYGTDAKWDPYHSEHFIAIDACTALTHKVNVLVLEDEFLS